MLSAATPLNGCKYSSWRCSSLVLPHSVLSGHLYQYVYIVQSEKKDGKVSDDGFRAAGGN